MSKLREYLEQKHDTAVLLEGNDKESKAKEEYIVDAEPGLIVAFRLNFVANSGANLTKVISGKIIENIQDEQAMVVETRNGLKYGVPYAAITWVKTGSRWPKGVYEEMKRGSVEIDNDEEVKGSIDFTDLVDDTDVDREEE